MRAVLLHKIYINKITLQGSQAPSIPAHLAVPGNVPRWRNLIVYTLTVGDGPWQCLAPNQAAFSQANCWPRSGVSSATTSWDVTNPFWSVTDPTTLARAPPCQLAPPPGQPQLFLHWQIPTADHQHHTGWASLGSPTVSRVGVSNSLMFSYWRAEPATMVHGPHKLASLPSMDTYCCWCFQQRQCTLTLVTDLP